MLAIHLVAETNSTALQLPVCVLELSHVMRYNFEDIDCSSVFRNPEHKTFT